MPRDTTGLHHEPVEELASAQQLHDEVEGRGGFVDLVQLHDVLVMQAGEDHGLRDHVLVHLLRQSD